MHDEHHTYYTKAGGDKRTKRDDKAVETFRVYI